MLFIALFIAPGAMIYYLSIRQTGRINAIEATPLFFVYGLLLITLAGIPSYFLEIKISSFLYILTTIDTFLIILAILKYRKIHGRFFAKQETKLATYLIISMVVLSLAIIAIMVQKPIYGDRIFHVGVSRRIATEQRITPNFLLFSETTEKIYPAYAFNGWHLSLAIMDSVLKIEPNRIWDYLIILLTPVQILSFYFLSRRVSKNGNFRIVATVIFVLYVIFFTGVWQWRLAPYPDQISRNIIIFIILGIYFDSILIKNLSWKRALWLGVCASLPIFIHMFSIIHIAMVFGPMAIYSTLARGNQFGRKAIQIVLAWMLCLIPMVLCLLSSYKGYSASQMNELVFSNKAMMVTDKYYIIKPARWLTFPIILTIISVLFIIIVQSRTHCLKGRHKTILVYCSLATALPILFAFTPPIATFIGDIITPAYLSRLSGIIPQIIILSLLAHYFINNRSKINTVIAIIFISAMAVYSFKPTYTLAKSLAKRPPDKTQSPIFNHSVFRYIDEQLPRHSIIAASTWNSYMIMGSTSQYVVMIENSPALVDVKKRISDLKQFMAGQNDRYYDQKIIQQYDIQYVLACKKELEKFDKDKSLYTPIKNFDAHNCTIYLVSRSSLK